MLSLPQRRSAVNDWTELFNRQLQVFFSSPILLATDGSVQGQSSACAVVCQDARIQCRLLDYYTPMFAELAAIDLALNHVIRAIHLFAGRELVLLTDSQSSLDYLASCNRHAGYFWHKIVFILQNGVTFKM